MRAVLIESERLRGTGIYFCSTTFDLGVPRGPCREGVAMGRRADPDVWALTGREGLTDFLELYRAWHELVDYDPPPVLGETALESDRRGEAAYARLKAVEASLLNHQPTSPVEIIGMQEVIASD